MQAISLKLPEDLLEASGKQAKALKISRAEYIRRAIENMNGRARAQARGRRLAAASLKVRRQSMEVNAEFARIEGDPEA